MQSFTIPQVGLHLRTGRRVTFAGHLSGDRPMPARSPRTVYVAGVEGCRAGWVVALFDLSSCTTTLRLVSKFSDILPIPEAPLVLAVNMPIGLLTAAVQGGRECDLQARTLLFQRRGSSVFSPPIRGALAAQNFQLACNLNRASSPSAIGISQQCFQRFHKMREVDGSMSPALQARVFEVHPELSFYALLGGKPMLHGTKTLLGRRERAQAIAASVMRSAPSATAIPGAAADDVMNAVVACWTAERIHAGRAVRLPFRPATDARGLRMEIWR